MVGYKKGVDKRKMDVDHSSRTRNPASQEYGGSHCCRARFGEAIRLDSSGWSTMDQNLFAIRKYRRVCHSKEFT
jgi:hypothetical protein